jgi:hypothetical protein
VQKLPSERKITQKILLEIGIILTNHHTNQASAQIIKHKVINWLEGTQATGISNMVPDMSKDLKKANLNYFHIGWDQWIQGRMATNWGILQNYDIKIKNSGRKFNAAKKCAKELIALSWEFAHDSWLAQNAIEHDHEGEPEIRNKVKLIKTIRGEVQMRSKGIYKQADLKQDVLLQLPCKNLRRLEDNIKNVRRGKNEDENMQSE